MDATTAPEMTQAAAAFDDLLVAAVFRSFARLAADEVAPLRGQRLLDVACGTGVLAQELAARLGDPAGVVGVDANPAMLEIARRGAPEIGWQRADAACLPFEAERFDHVVCQFAVMLFDDPEAALSEMWRVLAPGGALTVLVFDALERNPVYDTIAARYGEWIGPVLSQALRAAFSLGREGDLEAVFRAAGTAAPTIRTHTITARFPSVEALVLSDVKGWFPFSGVTLKQPVIDLIVADMKQALAPHVAADGSLSFPVAAHMARAVRP